MILSVPQRYDVIIVGAGPAGLTAAYELAKRGKRILVLELHPKRVGGISRTEDWDGFRFDIGGHRFYSKSREITELWKEILPSDLLTRNRLSRVYFNKRFFFYPLRPLNVMGTLGLFESLRCTASFALQKLRFPRPVVSFEDWVVRAFGRRLFTLFFKTYTEKVWGMDCSQISADWAQQRIRGLSFSVALKHMLAPFSRKTKVRTLAESFSYPRLGPGMMWEKASALVTALGGEIRLGEKVIQLCSPNETRPWRVLCESKDGTREFETDFVITSAPLRETLLQLEPAASLPSQQAASQLKYRDFVTVVLKTRGNDLFQDNWIYIHDPQVRVGRIQNYKAWSPDLVPDKALGLYGLEYFCNEGDRLWQLSDSDLIELAVKELIQIGLATEDQIVEGHVCRQPKAYPVYDRHYRAHLDVIRQELEKRPGLQTVGRNGMHRYNNQDHSMLTGLMAAKNILGHSQSDLWSVNEDEGYLEESAGDSPSQNSRSTSGERLVPLPLAT